MAGEAEFSQFTLKSEPNSEAGWKFLVLNGTKTIIKHQTEVDLNNIHVIESNQCAFPLIRITRSDGVYTL